MEELHGQERIGYLKSATNPLEHIKVQNDEDSKASSIADNGINTSKSQTKPEIGK